MSRFETWVEVVETGMSRDFRTFEPGCRHWSVDGVEVSEEEFEAARRAGGLDKAETEGE